MPQVITYAPAIDSQQINDSGMKKLIENVSSVSSLWSKTEGGFTFASPSLLFPSLHGAKDGDLIILYGHGSKTNNSLFNYEGEAIVANAKWNAAAALPEIMERDGLGRGGKYLFAFCVCYAGLQKSPDHLTPPPHTGSFCEAFRDAAEKADRFKGSVIWGPTGVAYREINFLLWMDYEDKHAKKQSYGLAGLKSDRRDDLFWDDRYQILKI